MKNHFIIRVVAKSLSFLSDDQSRKLRTLLEEELYNYDLNPTCTALVPVNNMTSMINLFLASKKLDGLSIKTLKNYYRTLNHFSSMIQKNIEDVNDMDIRMFLSQASNRGNKNTTLSTLISTFKSFFGWLTTQEYITKDPTKKIGNIKVEKRIRKSLTREELTMLRDACKTLREKAVVEFFYSTGARLDEAYKVDKSDIDWTTGKLTVIGKGNKERVVYLNDSARYHIKKYLKSRNDDDSALFVRERRPNTRLCARMLEEIFSKLGKRAGISKPVYPHLMRHTMATHMLNSGSPLTAVQRILGHEDPATTEIYATIEQEDVRNSHLKSVV